MTSLLNELNATERDQSEAAHPSNDQRDLARIVEACERAAAGDLEARIVEVPDGPLAQVCHAINRMLDTADSFVRETAAAMDACSRDVFHRPILLRGLKGAYGQSAVVINRAGMKMKQNKLVNDGIREAAMLAAENVQHVNTVAAACEEMSTTGGEISRQTAEAAKTAVMTGETNNLHQAMISMQEASVAFQLMVEVRNKLVESYQELMRMQV